QPHAGKHENEAAKHGAAAPLPQFQQSHRDQSDRPVLTIFMSIDDADVFESEQDADNNNEQAHHKLRRDRTSGLRRVHHSPPSVRSFDRWSDASIARQIIPSPVPTMRSGHDVVYQR